MWFLKGFGVPFLFDADGGTGSGGESKTFTQEEVNRITGDARAKGRTSYESDLLQKLGLKSIDDLTGIVQAARQAEEKSKTDIEKLQGDLGQAQTELANLKDESQKTIDGLRARILNSEIKAVASRAVLDKDGKSVLRHPFRADALDDVILLIDRSLISEKEDGSFEGIEKAVEELAKSKAWMLDVPEKPQSKGTPIIREQKVEGKSPAPKASSGVVVRL